MSRVDENGVRHLTDTDTIDVRTDPSLRHLYVESPTMVTEDELALLVRWVKGTRAASLLSEEEVRGLVLAMYRVEVMK